MSGRPNWQRGRDINRRRTPYGDGNDINTRGYRNSPTTDTYVITDSNEDVITDALEDVVAE